MSIVIKNLTYTYNPGTPFEKQALKDVSFTVESGEFMCIIGHTGSGKSTFIQHLNGLIGVLENHSNTSAYLHNACTVSGVHSKNLYRAIDRHKQTVEQLRNGTLSASVMTDKGDKLSLFDGKAYATQSTDYLLVLAVVVKYVL